jgi:RNA polymerase sigma-70 factor (ECF subfamily)
MNVALKFATVNPGFESERSLVMACQEKKVGAFETLYRQHAGRLKSVSYHILGNRQDAEDAVQETFIKAYRGINGFRGASTIGTWLCHILVNVCYDKLPTIQPATELAIEHESITASPSMRLVLEDALKRIHAKHRMVFLLHEAEGFTHSEIASILRIPEGTSKAWLSEAKQELKEILGYTK